MVEGEVIHIEAETAIVAKLEGLIDLIQITRLAKGGHAHHLILALVDFEAEIGCESRVEESQRMGEFGLSEEIDAILALAAECPHCMTDSGSGPLANTVDGEHCCFLEGG